MPSRKTTATNPTNVETVEEIDPTAHAVLTATPDPAPVRGRRRGSDRLEQFRAAAERQAERIPSVTIVLDEGQSISGLVRKRGKTIHPTFGESPVILFDPAEWDTDAPVTWAPEGEDGILIDDVPQDHGAVIVGMGTVLGELANAMPDDFLHITRHPDQKAAGSGQTYKNFTIICQRDGLTLPLQEHAERAAALAAARIRDRFESSLSGVTVPTEEPF